MKYRGKFLSNFYLAKNRIYLRLVFIGFIVCYSSYLGGAMKPIVSTFFLASLSAAHATTPIEPVLLPVMNEAEKINIHMGKYEVTVAEFSRFVRATGYQVPKKCMLFSSRSWPSPDTPGRWDDAELVEDPYRPVTCVGVAGARAYAGWLSEVTGKSYRLPELKEWQYAASAGSAARFAFGEDFAQTEICDYENVEDLATVAGIKRDHKHRYEHSANCNDGAVYHTVVGMYRPNAFGLHDMMGNVRELLQTCRKWSDTRACIEYAIAGEAWHWQARGVSNPDWIGADFYGSIEGFRLVLDDEPPALESAETASFREALNKAQVRARKRHLELKSIPLNPEGLEVQRIDPNKVRLSWNATEGKGITYSIYRSEVNKHSTREALVIAEGITETFYLDTPKGYTTYWVYAKSEFGESMASAPASVGALPAFEPGQRIEAEHYLAQRHTWINFDERQQSVGFSSNTGHYPTGKKPFLPAWVKYPFSASKPGQVEVSMRWRSQPGAQLELWQGHHLVTRIRGGDKAFSELKLEGELIAGDMPLQIRAANQAWAEVDWLEITAL